MTQKRRLAWALALLFVVNIAVISLAQQAEAATYRQGSSGEQGADHPDQAEKLGLL